MHRWKLLCILLLLSIALANGGMRGLRIPAIGVILSSALVVLYLNQSNNYYQPIRQSQKYKHGGTYIIKSKVYEIINITAEAYSSINTFKSEDDTEPHVTPTSETGNEIGLSNNPSGPYISATSADTSKSESETYLRGNYDTGSGKFDDESYDSLDTSRFLWDSSRNYLWKAFVKTGSGWKEVSGEWKVCLSTQASVEHLFWLAHHSNVWKGPISVSVYVPGADYTVAVHMIIYLQQCFPQVREFVSFHFLYPAKAPPKLKDFQYNLNLFNCQEPENFNRFLVEILRDKDLKNFLTKTFYPQNLLRNIARQECPCEYAITPDMDMLAVEGMSQDLNQFLMKAEVLSCDKCAYVVPVYEISKNVTINPRNKAQLLELVKQELARQFHAQVFKPNQENSDLERWESLDANQSFDVAYNISHYRNHWEPIYVAKANNPPFNERFVGYGFTRNTQVYEMQLSGYQWKMFTNAFFCHRGFQTSGSYSTQRRFQINENRDRFYVFRKKMLARHNVSVLQYPLFPNPKNKILPIDVKVKKKIIKTNKTIGSITPINHKKTISKSSKDEGKVFVNFLPV